VPPVLINASQMNVLEWLAGNLASGILNVHLGKIKFSVSANKYEDKHCCYGIASNGSV